MLKHAQLSAKKRNLLNMKLHPYAVPTLSLGFPSEPCGEPAELDCTRTNSSLVTVATDSVELLTLPSEELSSMASRFPEGRPGEQGEALPFPPVCPAPKEGILHAGTEQQTIQLLVLQFGKQHLGFESLRCI